MYCIVRFWHHSNSETVSSFHFVLNPRPRSASPTRSRRIAAVFAFLLVMYFQLLYTFQSRAGRCQRNETLSPLRHNCASSGTREVNRRSYINKQWLQRLPYRGNQKKRGREEFPVTPFLFCFICFPQIRRMLGSNPGLLRLCRHWQPETLLRSYHSVRSYPLSSRSHPQFG